MNLLYLSILLVSSAIFGTSSIAARTPPKTLVVQASKMELRKGYLTWIHSHPTALPPSGVLDLATPAIAYYSASGKLLFSGTNSEENAHFTYALINGRILHDKLSGSSTPRPSLDSALHMFKEVRPYEKRILSNHRATVIVLADPGRRGCQQEDSAFHELREKATTIGVNFIEVVLHD